MTGLEPRGFVWVIAGRLAVSERIGGYGFQHRRVRRQEEINWIKNQGVTAVLSLLPGPQNLASYDEDALEAFSVPLAGDIEDDEIEHVFATISEVLADPAAVLLVHRDIVDDVVAGLLGGYLVYSGLIADPIVATSIIQEIVGRPLAPEGRRFIPDATRS